MFCIFSDNLQSYLQDKVGLPVKERVGVTQAIFGGNGVVQSDSVLCYEERCNVLLENLALYPRLTHYLEHRMLPLIKEHVLEPVWRYGLPNFWTNNNAESLHHVLKQSTGWKIQQLPELIETLHGVAKFQCSETERAILARGEFILAPSYKRYLVQPQVWAGKTEEERRNLLRKFLKNRKATQPGKVTSTDGKLNIPVTPSAGKKPNQRKRRRAERTKTVK